MLFSGNVGHRCGKNYGWSIFEGSRCLQSQEARIGSCAAKSRAGFTFPIFQYCHADYYDDASGESTYTAGVDICGDRSVVGNAVIGKFSCRLGGREWVPRGGAGARPVGLHCGRAARRRRCEHGQKRPWTPPPTHGSHGIGPPRVG